MGDVIFNSTATGDAGGVSLILREGVGVKGTQGREGDKVGTSEGGLLAFVFRGRGVHEAY